MYKLQATKANTDQFTEEEEQEEEDKLRNLHKTRDFEEFCALEQNKPSRKSDIDIGIFILAIYAVSSDKEESSSTKAEE